MLLHARATLLRLEREVAESEIKATTARSRTRGLKQSMENLEAVPSRIEELEREVERLEAAAAMNRQLQREVERLKAAARGRVKRDSRNDTPKAARARPKRDAKRDTPKGARARPKRNAKHDSSKRTDMPQAKARRRDEGGKRTHGNDGG
jgi:hypothetical protein